MGKRSMMDEIGKEKEKEEKKSDEEIIIERMQEEVERRQEEVEEANEKVRRMEKEMERMKEDIKDGIFKKGKIFGREGKRYEDPILIMINEDGDSRIIEKVNAGVMKYKMEGSKKEEVLGYLDPKRKIRIPDGMGGEYDAWIKHEREFGCYPMDIINDTEQISILMTKLQHQYRELDLIDKIAGHINITLFRNIILLVIIVMAVLTFVFIAWPITAQRLGWTGAEAVTNLIG